MLYIRSTRLLILLGMLSLMWVSGCDTITPSSDQISADQTPHQRAPSDDPSDSSPEPLGDPDRGYDILVNTGYVSCGIPEGLSSLINLGDERDRIPGRNVANRVLPYYLTHHQRHYK